MILAAEAATSATSATTPLWVTVLTPTLTLVGVLWTQRAADRRADRDAERRIEHERERALVERVHVLYADLLRKPWSFSNPLLRALAASIGPTLTSLPSRFRPKRSVNRLLLRWQGSSSRRPTSWMKLVVLSIVESCRLPGRLLSIRQ
ncbi:hypothetical protein [Pseudonocardia sp. TMWB2A]|uniref:hypothetical protein n=1 Tax=Pseudonocardia sp. TMWB2A TaxID=687430 RepID=UPI00307E5714